VIRENMLADIILLERRRYNYCPNYNPIHSIVYASYGCEVTHVIIDGKIILEDSILLTIDEEKVLDKIEQLKYKFI